MSFGYHRSEILGALFSTLVIWVLTGVLVYLAIQRVINLNSFTVEPIPMVVTASCGVVFNIIMWLVLHTNVCFRGINLGHHGHSHSGDGQGHGHGHSHSSGSGRGGGGNHNHSHSGGEHGHSHANGADHGHSHRGNTENDQGNGNSISTGRAKSGTINSYTIPITDTFTLPSNNPECDDDTAQIVQDDHSDEPDVNDSNNINLRAAAIHVIGDFVQSVGVLIAAVIIYFNVSFSFL